MGIVSAITAALNAFAQAAKAFPVWLAWKITGECEQITKDIILNENRGTPSGQRTADELRIALAYRRRLHDALLPAHAAPEGGDEGDHVTRAIPVPE